MASHTQELVQSYESGIPRWKINLALSRIIGFGFPEHEWDGLLQNLAIEIVGFRYDPEKSNGAKESTALYSLIDNRLRGYVRSEYRQQIVFESLEERMEASGESVEDSPRFRRGDKKALRFDVRQAVASLPSAERTVCEGLMHGETIGQIARRLRCGWHTANRTLARIRGRFERMGLHAWITG